MLLHCDDVGLGSCTVLLHGFPFDNTMWKHQKSEIEAVYRLITPDLRGFGRSVAPDGAVYSIDEMADDVVETIESLGIEGPVVLGGLSMGGYVALSIAVRYPTRLRGLMLLDTRAAADSPEAAKGREETARQVEVSQDTDLVVRSMLSRLFSPVSRERRGDVVGHVEAMMRRVPHRVVAATLRGLAARPDRTPDLAKIAVPTLVLVGADDEIAPVAEAQQIASALPSATLAVIPEAGHLAPLENPGPANEAIRRFLGGLG